MHEHEESIAYGPEPRSTTEELANTVTHAIGLLLSFVGAIVLVSYTLAQGDAWRVVGCTVYAAALVAVYAASTLSHVFSAPQWRHRFRTLDQGFIYLLIVGTYTPFALAYLRTAWWWLFFALMWSVALSGFFSKVLFAHRVEVVSIWTYVVLGWMPVISGMGLVGVAPGVALRWMIIGGVCYTLGCVFLAFDARMTHFHAIWHLFVIAGSACHFFSILLFVAPVG